MLREGESRKTIPALECFLDFSKKFQARDDLFWGQVGKLSGVRQEKGSQS